MGKYSIIKKEFEFLKNIYGFEISLKQKHGAWYFIEWTNPNINIKVLYDDQVDERVENPLSILIYDALSLGFDAVEYKEDLWQRCKKPREKIHCAAEWLRQAITDKRIII